MLSSSAAGAAAAATDKTAILSASVVVAVENERGAGGACDYRVCLVKRSAGSRFMPNAAVFPGGVIEPEDHDFAARAAEQLGFGGGDSSGSSSSGGYGPGVRVGAIRELFEEAGIAATAPRRLGNELREVVHEDAALFAPLCHAAAVMPDVGALLPWARFITPDFEVQKSGKGFDAAFFLLCEPAAGGNGTRLVREAKADDGETRDLVWLCPAEAISLSERGGLFLPPPQWFILHELATECPRFADLVAYASSAARSTQRDLPMQPLPVASEWTAAAEKRIELALPGDEKHPQHPGGPGCRHRIRWARGEARAYSLVKQLEGFAPTARM
jgi:nucleoside diphosphate-linked moiety X motif 19, mitochondrial